MHEKPSPDWDPRDPAVLADQRAAYDDLRERCPVASSDLLGWSLFRHADVVRVLDDPATFSNASRHPAVPNGMDPPEHTRYRRALEPFFDPEPMAAFEPRCREVARDHVGRLLERPGRRSPKLIEPPATSSGGRPSPGFACATGTTAARTSRCRPTASAAPRSPARSPSSSSGRCGCAGSGALPRTKTSRPA